jgi:hypothetical protein
VVCPQTRVLKILALGWRVFVVLTFFHIGLQLFLSNISHTCYIVWSWIKDASPSSMSIDAHPLVFLFMGFLNAFVVQLCHFLALKCEKCWDTSIRSYVITLLRRVSIFSCYMTRLKVKDGQHKHIRHGKSHL